MPSKLQTALDNWQDWPVSHKPSLVKIFTAGLNHQTYLIETEQHQFVLKLFRISMQHAIDAQKFAASFDLAPPITYSNTSYDVALMDYVDESTISASEINTEVLQKVGAALAKLHSLPTTKIKPSIGKFDLMGFYNNYLNEISEQRIHLINAQLKPALDIFLNDSTTNCFCHNDLVTENCFINKGKVQLIDWEYAQLHNPWFDLAAVIYYFDLNDNQAREFLACYGTDYADRIAEPIFYAAQCALLWGDILWYIANNKEGNHKSVETKLSDLAHLTKHLNIHLDSYF